jgi:hypothetical protein
MTQRPDITQPDNMLAIQGDLVLVYRHEGETVTLAHTLTLVRVLDVGRQEMRMVNRASKNRKPDWLFTQAWYDRLRPAQENKEGAQWEVTLKPK